MKFHVELPLTASIFYLLAIESFTTSVDLTAVQHGFSYILSSSQISHIPSIGHGYSTENACLDSERSQNQQCRALKARCKDYTATVSWPKTNRLRRT